MKSLFLRIFLWFCGASAVIGLVVTAGFLVDSPDALATNWRSVGQGAIVAAARTAAETYERGGRAELARYLQSLARDTGFHAVLLDASRQDLTGGRSPRAAAVAAIVASRYAGELTIFPRRRVAGVWLHGPSGKSYAFVTVLPPRERGPWGRRFLVLFILVGGLLCYALARHVSGPILHVRAATAKFSSGDLTARITLPRVLDRKDEIGSLARDFNQMASRIEGLMRAQQRLIADVSHELRSPITRLSLALGLLRRRSEPDSRTSVARMEREVERLNALISQLLTLSRLECSDQPPPMESFDLGALVREVAADAAFEATSVDRGVELVECAECSARGARDLLRSAVENVVRNAIKYTNPNTQVSIRLLRPSGSATAIIVVEDEGPGVPAEALSHLFEPFYRVDEARDRGSGGAGLGLAIAQQIVALHGGSVNAANREQGGLAVRITLPVVTG
jgi:two-component system sensor histidine kinase CpxA